MCESFEFIDSSDHEWQVNVLDAIADIDGSVDRCVTPVEAEVAGPELTSQSGNCLGCVLHHTPA